jgi:DNA-binding NarL/FixJ family response regulator
MYVIPRRFPSRNYYPRGPGLLAIMALSTRELEVLELMGNGYTTIEIAEFLGVRPATVETHQHRMKSKLNLKNGAHLLYAAIRWVDFRARLQKPCQPQNPN